MQIIKLLAGLKQKNRWCVYGDEIDIKVKQDQEFSEEALFELLTSIPEARAFSVNLSDYEMLYEELTGDKWTERHVDF